MYARTMNQQEIADFQKMESAAVVLIDDEESMCEGCRQTLEEEGLATQIARDGSEGLRLVASVRPNVVLVDLKMPGISGLEVLEKIPGIDPTIVPIVLTGYGTIDSAVESMKIGAFDFLTKPFEPEKLVETVRRGIELSELRSASSRVLEEEPPPEAVPEIEQDDRALLLKGLSAIGSWCSTGRKQSEYFDELRKLESDAKFHARSLQSVKERQRMILDFVKELRLVDDIIRKYEYQEKHADSDSAGGPTRASLAAALRVEVGFRPPGHPPGRNLHDRDLL